MCLIIWLPHKYALRLASGVAKAMADRQDERGDKGESFVESSYLKGDVEA